MLYNIYLQSGSLSVCLLKVMVFSSFLHHSSTDCLCKSEIILTWVVKRHYTNPIQIRNIICKEDVFFRQSELIIGLLFRHIGSNTFSSESLFFHLNKSLLPILWFILHSKWDLNQLFCILWIFLLAS